MWGGSSPPHAVFTNHILLSKKHMIDVGDSTPYTNEKNQRICNHVDFLLSKDLSLMLIT